MKILNKMILSFVLIVLIFGMILTFEASLDSERELKNINSLYEERGISIAKTIDASIMSDSQLHNDSQTIVDRLMASSLDVAMINIHGKAPDGIIMPGYWRGYWILASSTKSNVHLPSKAVDIAAMNTNKYILASYNENGKPIIDVIYPLHDPSGKTIATAEIEYDMSAIQSQMLMKKTNNMQIALILTLLAIIATIFKHKETLDNLENLVKERTSKLEAAFNSLKESEKSLAEAQQMAHIGSWDRNLRTNELYWSDETYRIFGFEPKEFVATYGAFLSYIHPDDRDYVNNTVKKALNGKPFGIDFRILLANGAESVVHAQGGTTFDEKNIPVHMKGTVQDITERKKAEEALAKIEIARKQEIHHRIKNNLQVISSLLDIQAEKFNNREYITDSEVMEAFKESQNRVISMALIHEELYKGGGLETLNFSPYIEELAENLFQTYNIGNTDISLKMDLDKNIFFDMDTAVPLGIIINELVSNSLIHAFPGTKKGEIRIKLNREENEECTKSINKNCKSTIFTLTVSDNGFGIPENLDIEELDTLGFQLITSLVDQLDGKFELKRNNGTEFTMRFKVIEKK
jgi:PAS domain S-box-containing protein